MYIYTYTYTNNMKTRHLLSMVTEVVPQIFNIFEISNSVKKCFSIYLFMILI